MVADTPDASGPPLSKTAYVLQRLRRELAEGSIDPGSPLRQAEIAARYGVSATPVREALRVLEAEGRIDYSPNRGATVADMPPAGVRDTYLLRATLEGLGAQLAAERAPDAASFADARRFHMEIIQRKDDVPGAELARLNKALHVAIYDLGSRLVCEQVQSVWKLVPASVTVWEQPSAADVFSRQHESLLEALEQRDADAAQRLAFEHIMTAFEFRSAAVVDRSGVDGGGSLPS